MTRIPTAQPKSPIADSFLRGDIDDLASIFYGLYDRIADHGHGNPNIVVAPATADGSPDWESADPTTLQKPSSDSGPADIAEAKRWALLVDDVSGCDDQTSMLVWLDAATGQPNMAQIAGPTVDADIAMRIIGRDIGAAPPPREIKLGQLASSLAEFMEKRAPANDNKPSAESPLIARLKALQQRYGGSLHTSLEGWPCLIAVEHNGGIGSIVPNVDGGFVFMRTGKKPVPIEEVPVVTIAATPFALVDPSTLPQRDWLFGRHFIRRYLTATVGAGGGGKSAHAVSEVLAMVTGRPLLDPDGPLTTPIRVWYVNAEDPQDEIDRRFHAAAKHFRVTAEQIGDRLFTDSGRDQEFVIMRQEGRDLRVCQPLIDEMVAEIQRRKIDVVIIDPFVSTHEVAENDNGAMQRVAKAWTEVADRANCSVEVIHHVAKNQGEVTADSARGGGALKDKTRGMRVLNPMTRDESEKAGLESPDGYFRIDNGKVNLVASGRSQWRRFVNVPLGNGKGMFNKGDEIGVVEAWRWPSRDDLAEREAAARAAIVADVPEEVLAGMRVRLDNGAYKANVQAASWAGKLVAELLDIDLSDKDEKARVKAMLAAWVANGDLRIVTEKDAHRHDADFVRSGAAPQK